MPRRKRISGQNERRRKVRRKDGDDDDDTPVISDSKSDEEEEDCAVKLSPRAARRLGRERKAQVQEMTEEEMVALALRLSKQEASSATEREQVEDDDMKKAIAESLQVKADVVRCSQASETSSKELQSRTAEKPAPDRDTVTSHARCKLSFPSKDGEGSRSDEKVLHSQTSPLKRFGDVSPLPSMPDLSQKTWSQTSPPSPTLPFVPSQESQLSGLVKRERESPSPQGEHPQRDPELPKSPVFLRNCSVKLNHFPCSNTSSFGVTSPDQSPNSPRPPKSPVFSKTDSKQCTKSTRDDFSDCTHDSSFTDSAGKPPNTIQESTSHKNRDFSTRLSHSRKAQPSARVSVPGDDEQSQEAVKLQQATHESSRATSSHTASGGAPNSTMPLSSEDRSMDEFTSHMVLHLSDDDDDDDDEDVNEEIIPPSPVFPQDRSSRDAQPKLSPTQPCGSPPTAVTSKYAFQTKSPTQADSELPDVSRKSADTRLAPIVERKEERLVSYYWGVPFCPKGQSPDDYTRVILTQLEVYEKSLKEAQRQLLHKVDWGLPVSPCPMERPHGRRPKRHRVPKLLEEDEEEEEEKEDEGRGEDLKEKKKKDEWKEREEAQQCLEDEAESGQHETYVVLSSPETHEELERKSPLQFEQQGPTHSAKPSRNSIVQDLSEDTLRQSGPEEHGEEVQKKSFDVESTVCPESQMTEDNTPELMVTSPAQPHAESDVMEVDEIIEPAAVPDESMEQERPGEEQSWRESVPSQVECPMCTCLFPLSKVEIHAAYCDGTVGDEDEEEDQEDNLSHGSTRRKSVKRPPLEDVRFEKSEQREKCFLCSKFFTSKDYSHHVDQCIQQKTPKQGNGLLSALNRTETVHLDDSGAGPSNTTYKTSRGPADTSVRPGVSADPEAPGYYVSTSPIKSFTPISELTGCLINFRQQYSDRTNQRLGRKRKFKR